MSDTHAGPCCEACMKNPTYLTKAMGREVCCHFQLQAENWSDE